MRNGKHGDALSKIVAELPFLNEQLCACLLVDIGIEKGMAEQQVKHRQAPPPLQYKQSRDAVHPSIVSPRIQDVFQEEHWSQSQTSDSAYLDATASMDTIREVIDAASLIHGPSF